MEQTSKQQEAIGWKFHVVPEPESSLKQASKEYPSHLATNIGAETSLLTETHLALASFTALPLLSLLKLA